MMLPFCYALRQFGFALAEVGETAYLSSGVAVRVKSAYTIINSCWPWTRIHVTVAIFQTLRKNCESFSRPDIIRPCWIELGIRKVLCCRPIFQRGVDDERVRGARDVLVSWRQKTTANGVKIGCGGLVLW
jgi:hypothetical protein